MTRLNTLDLGHNPGLTGPIPSELGKLRRINGIGLTETSLSGSVPEELCERFVNRILFYLSVDCEEVECDCACCLCNCVDLGSVIEQVPWIP